MTFVELRFNLWKRINSRVGDFFGRPLPTAYVLSLPFIFWFWLSLLLFVKFDANLLVLRAFNFVGNGLGTGHYLTWVVIALVVTVWGWDNILAGVLVVGLYSALHEAFWYVFYFVAYPGQFSVTFPFYLPFVYLGACLSIGYVLLSHHRSIPSIPTKAILEMVALFIVIDAMWLVAGFPVTISLTTGGTQYFLNLMVNLIEDNSWVVPAVPLVVAGLSKFFASHTLINRKRTGALK
jgi:hypothetical protein